MSDRELVDRMRTCAATLMASKASGNPWDIDLLAGDAAALLNEAANALDKPVDASPAVPAIEELPPTFTATWTAPSALPAVSAPDHGPVALPNVSRPCPRCGEVSTRGVFRDRRRIMLACPVCSYQWEYKP